MLPPRRPRLSSTGCADGAAWQPDGGNRTITAIARTGNKYSLKVTGSPRPGYREGLATPAADVALAAYLALASDPSDSERATAELLNYAAATWDQQDLPLRDTPKPSLAPCAPGRDRCMSQPLAPPRASAPSRPGIPARDDASASSSR
ncbi:hypothetical protein [Streptomyces sp. Je 1-369]|uniref:hypothetical protein n=1 Tax=Streptomyces sp. Je 1-369 TaxID=2966192 RepID=UPI0022862F79|nr:hypothetical protein [Streptomyces sp. Je 1-369]WAL93246.1 hypothetical protein NOO62_01305 [Streptomyces sp. Je 1-369]